MLGFLPHELDYTHLRMLWRRWKKKANISFLGKSVTPFGPRKLDTLLATVLQLHGDLIPDFRLIDYFITLLSTDTCPALNGIPGNQELLKSELSEMGIFDSRMSMYLPYRMRAYEYSGYSGFEGRSYSLFPRFIGDMSEAVDLQNLVTALAYKLAIQEDVLHQDIPDQQSIESERRQMFFATAICVPTVYIRTGTGNRFLRRILLHIQTQRSSKRYKNYLRITIHDYRLALLEVMRGIDPSLSAGDYLSRIEKSILMEDATAETVKNVIHVSLAVTHHLNTIMIPESCSHQYIDRSSQQIVTEKLLGDRSVSFLYSTVRENAPALFKTLTSGRMSSLLSFYHFDFLDTRRKKSKQLFEKLNIDWRECVAPPCYYDTPRKVFERQICYWDLRPMTDDPAAVVSPADSRVLVGSFREVSKLFIKEKFFTAEELFGSTSRWHPGFAAGDFAVFRLTPDKYHYNHLPVSGRIADIYEVDGQYHSCNPSALIALASLYAKNKRVVTIIDTDVEGGSAVGMVAMIEIVALMIGDIVQAYSKDRYHDPSPVKPGMFAHKGCPKSLYRPGSSTDIVIFEPNRMEFSTDLACNSRRNDVQSRFTNMIGQPLVETDIPVRSTIGHRLNFDFPAKELPHD